jgi:hypothetical protein
MEDAYLMKGGTEWTLTGLGGVKQAERENGAEAWLGEAVLVDGNPGSTILDWLGV